MPDFGLNVLSKSAVLLLIVSSAFIIVAFSTDNWLANDGTRKSHFLKIGKFLNHCVHHTGLISSLGAYCHVVN